jgi:hypothetical protein
MTIGYREFPLLAGREKRVDLTFPALSWLNWPQLELQQRKRKGFLGPLSITEFDRFRNESFSLWNDPEFYSVSKADSRVFGTGHLDLTVVKHIPSVRLVFDQFVRFDNLNPPRAH